MKYTYWGSKFLYWLNTTWRSKGSIPFGGTENFFYFTAKSKSGINGPIHSKLNCADCVKNCTKNWTECSLAQHRFPIRFVGWFVECLEMMPLRRRQVHWGNSGTPWVNCAVLCVKNGWKGQFWDLRYYLSKLLSLLSFSVRYDVTQ
jgi:hypothetical protein